MRRLQSLHLPRQQLGVAGVHLRRRDSERQLDPRMIPSLYAVIGATAFQQRQLDHTDPQLDPPL